jgi:hypothetical protein
VSDVDLSCLITRGPLGLDDLELNDFERYYLGPELLGGTSTFNKTHAESPYLDGASLTAITRGLVNEKLTIEVLADDSAEMAANLAEVVQAFGQMDFRLQFTMNTDIVLVYQCEPASVQIPWAGPRVVAGQMQVVVQFDRQPQPVTGVF